MDGVKGGRTVQPPLTCPSGPGADSDESSVGTSALLQLVARAAPARGIGRCPTGYRLFGLLWGCRAVHDENQGIGGFPTGNGFGGLRSGERDGRENNGEESDCGKERESENQLCHVFEYEGEPVIFTGSPFVQ